MWDGSTQHTAPMEGAYTDANQTRTDRRRGARELRRNEHGALPDGHAGRWQGQPPQRHCVRARRRLLRGEPDIHLRAHGRVVRAERTGAGDPASAASSTRGAAVLI